MERLSYFALVDQDSALMTPEWPSGVALLGDTFDAFAA
jgi:hypothetical protein